VNTQFKDKVDSMKMGTKNTSQRKSLAEMIPDWILRGK
jgi:hypothetical protein